MKKNLQKTIGKYALRFFAVVGALVIGSLLAGALTSWYWVRHPTAALPAPENMVLDLDFSQPIVEQRNFLGLSLNALLKEQEETPLLDIVRALDRAKDDKRVKGIVARFAGIQPSLVHAQEIRAALQRFKESGKFTYVFATNYGDFGQGNRLYYLASAFENIWLQPIGTVGLTGLSLESPFGKTALNNLGVSTDFLRREEYKSVMENVARDSFSAPVRANMESLLKSISEQEIEGIAASRKLEPAKARQLLEEGPYTSQEALKAGLVTKLGYQDDMLEEAKQKAGDDPTRVDVGSYLLFSALKKEPKATIALINALGMISETPSVPSYLSDNRVIDTERLVEAFNEAAEDEDVQAILFRIDSPGGSPSASESIRHALVKAQEKKKPVFVSMGKVAASGGYWIAMNADRIIASPGTITGSIGVVAGKFVLGGLWKKLGVNWDSIRTSDNAALWSAQTPFSPHDRDRINAMLDETYNAFIGNVASARKIPLEKMADLAKGRVWTGEQAAKVGLVDELGGMETAVAALKKQLKLEPTDPIALKLFPPPETTADVAVKLLKNFGIAGVFFGKTLGSWQQVQAALGPYWDALQATSPIAARVPPEILRLRP